MSCWNSFFEEENHAKISSIWMSRFSVSVGREGRHADYSSLPLVKKDHVTIWGRGNLGSSGIDDCFQNDCHASSVTTVVV